MLLLWLLVYICIPSYRFKDKFLLNAKKMSYILIRNFFERKVLTLKTIDLLSTKLIQNF